MLLLPLEVLRLADNDSDALALNELLIDSLELSDTLVDSLALIDSDLLLLMLALSNPACDSLVLLSPFEVLRLAEALALCEPLRLSDADALVLIEVDAL